MTMMQAAQTPAPAPLPTLEESFELLKGYKPADDPTVLIPIDQAVMKVHGNAAARAALEQRLAGYLGASYSSVARSFACRELAIIGSAASVPGLVPLLLDDELSVFARQALERIPGPEADKALRDAILKSRGRTRIGIINSVAVRRDARSVALLPRPRAKSPRRSQPRRRLWARSARQNRRRRSRRSAGKEHRYSDWRSPMRS